MELIKNKLNDLSINASCEIKRGCSEFALMFNDYGKVDKVGNTNMNHPNHWESIEREFDEQNTIKECNAVTPSLRKFCLSDFLIIEQWIDYAKGISDETANLFDDLPIKYQDTFNLAKKRQLPNQS